MRARSMIALLAAAAAALAAAPAAAGDEDAEEAGAGLAIVREAALRDGGEVVDVELRLTCPAGETAIVTVTLRQGHDKGERGRTEGADYDLVACTGDEQAVTVVIDGLFPAGAGAAIESRAGGRPGPRPLADISGPPYEPGKARAIAEAGSFSGGDWREKAKRRVRLMPEDSAGRGT